MWTIARIDEADYGCEERLLGEPLKLLITLKNEDGAVRWFEAAENWIEMQGLEEGDEWPEDDNSGNDCGGVLKSPISGGR
jgi:hypothetical protein